MSSICLNAIKNRFACKKYLNKEIDDDILNQILQAGRLSPSSFGLEPWHFYVCKSKDILKECFYQESMKTSPITIVVTCKKDKYFDPDSVFVYSRLSRFPGSFIDAREDYRPYYNYLKDQNLLDSWSRSQAYIAVSNMMCVASELGVQSCAIEGFDNDLLLDKLLIDKEDELVGLVCTFGYPDEEAREKIRAQLDELVTYC